MNALKIKLNGKVCATIAPEVSPGIASVMITSVLNPKFRKRRGQLFRVNIGGMQVVANGDTEVFHWPKVSLKRNDVISIQQTDVNQVKIPRKRVWERANENKISWTHLK
jgi:hypothetical protein